MFGIEYNHNRSIILMECLKCGEFFPHLLMSYKEQRETFTGKGFCDQCYDGRNSETFKLINKLLVYTRNIKNIEKENYRQAGAREKYVRYKSFILRTLDEWQSTENYYPVKIFEGERKFFIQETVTMDDVLNLIIMEQQIE